MLAEAKYHLSQNYLEKPLEYEGFRLYQIGRLYCGGSMEVKKHTHFGWFEITAVTDGEGEVFTGDVGTKVKAGDLYLSFPNDIHAIRSSREKPLKYDFFSFSTELSPYKEELQNIAERLSPDNRLFWDRRINRCMEELTIAVDNGGKYGDILAASLIKELLIYLIRDFTPGEEDRNRKASKSPKVRRKSCVSNS